jgi:hypothetical protein
MREGEIQMQMQRCGKEGEGDNGTDILRAYGLACTSQTEE